MYSSGELAIKYLGHLLHAHNSKGHGIHSPFVFDLVTRVLRDSQHYPCYDSIESARKLLLQDHSMLEVADFGAGSSVLSSHMRKVSAIARTSLKNRKFAQLLYRIARHYHPLTVVELGTSLGITTSYLASAHSDAKIYTFEGASQVAQRARTVFSQLELDRIRLIEGDFTNTLVSELNSLAQVDLAFVDGNHRKDPTLQYYSLLKAKSAPRSVLIFDDIHWSREMEQAWGKIQGDPDVKLTIDLFFIGMVFFNPDFKYTQHFRIRF